MDLKTIQQVQSNVKDLMVLLGTGFVEPSVEVGESGTVKVDLKQAEGGEENLGILIGNHGETLLALEYVIALMVNRGREEWLRVELDLDGYRKKREEDLKGLAQRMAEKALFLKEKVELRPMPSADRRIIHMALSENPDIVTDSEGEGRERHVVISPASV